MSNKVEQRHRDAAADYMALRGQWSDLAIEDVRNGRADEADLVQTLAAFEASLARPQGGGEEAFSLSVDPKSEYQAFLAWVKNWLPSTPLPSPTSHLFDAWMASARHCSATPPADERGEALREALTSCLALIDDMSRFVGQMSLRDYALFNEAPMLARAALATRGGGVMGAPLRLEAEINRLNNLLDRYGSHKRTCRSLPMDLRGGGDCECGWQHARAAHRDADGGAA
jgi:hypothetical protein